MMKIIDGAFVKKLKLLYYRGNRLSESVKKKKFFGRGRVSLKKSLVQLTGNNNVYHTPREQCRNQRIWSAEGRGRSRAAQKNLQPE